jgi:hypothetical protein
MSQARTAANRANAKRSTGPKTTHGKQASAQNALRHGLNRPVTLQGDDARWAKVLAEELSQGRQDRLGIAFAAAQWLHRLKQIAALRERAMTLALERINEECDARLEVREDLALLAATPELLRLEDYERRAHSKLRKLLKEL